MSIRGWTRCGAALAAAMLTAIGMETAPAAAAPSAVAGSWLTDVNVYRAIGGVRPVTENMAYDLGDQSHAQYMVQNNVLTHDEQAGNPWYTPAGSRAGLA